MALLEPSFGLDPNWSRGGGEISIIDDSALLPEVGPASSFIEPLNGANPNGKISVYIVRQGDTLSQVAEMYGVSVNTILWANDLPRATAIRAGQTLVILPITGVNHTVASGDTLEKLAKKYNSKVEEIISFNGLDSDAGLAVGSIVLIPDGVISTPSPSARAVAGSSNGSTVAVENGYYFRPIKGGVKTQGIHGYNGVDLATSAGSNIYAAASGKVVTSRFGGWNGGYGNYIVIEHNNGTQTLYAHTLKNFVSAGDKVERGQVIGEVGSTGRSTGAHVHFEVRGAKNPF